MVTPSSGTLTQEEILAVAEQMVQQGWGYIYAQAYARGYAEGYAQGYMKGARKTLLRLLTAEYGPIDDLLERRIDAALLEQLDTWMLRLIHAPTLTEVFTD
jgi:flagellar biosynthesis/type III secretory pathway protein FliH